MSPVTAAIAVRMAAPLPAFCGVEERADAVVGSASASAAERAHDVGGAVGRRVVDDDDLLADRHRAHALDQLADRQALVEDGHDDREGEVERIGGVY